MFKESEYTSSIKFQKFIETNFPNAVTISDEISMSGNMNSGQFRNVVLNNSSDMLLAHGGTLNIFRRREMQLGIRLIDDERIRHRLGKILNLKYKYKLFEISDYYK